MLVRRVHPIHPSPLSPLLPFPRRHRRRCDDVFQTRPRAEDSMSSPQPAFPTIESCVGATPLVRLQRLVPSTSSNVVLLKLEGNNPAGSVKDRPALKMIQEAERRGEISPGDALIEATSGNTGIALAMCAAIKGYRLKLIMPENMSEERRQAMAAYGAECISVPPGSMEIARDLAKEMEAKGEGKVLDQFGNLDNPSAHYTTTGPELMEQTGGKITHFVTSMGTTGTAMGVSRYFKEAKPGGVEIIGLQPREGAKIAGIRRWPKEYLPGIFESGQVDRVMEIGQVEAEEMMRCLARVEGIFCGVSSGGAVNAALRLSAEVENACICVIACDRGDRYLSTGVFNTSISLVPRPTDVSNFYGSLACLTGLKNPVVLFTSGVDEETGLPWCPDCVLAEPIVEDVMRSLGSLLIVRVGSKAEWKSPEHPFRRDGRLRLQAIPTMFKFKNGTLTDNLEGSLFEECKTASDVESLVRTWMCVKE